MNHINNKISEIRVSYTNNDVRRVKISNSKECYQTFIKEWNVDTIELQEEFKILMLNRNNQVLGIYQLSKGGVSATVVDAKLIFSVALKCNSSAITIAHNHPSGNLTPSKSDKELTKKLIKASNYLDIIILDHLIISKDSFYSFADNGLM